MRLASLSMLASCLLSPVAIAADGEREDRLRNEALQDRGVSQRRHWLYDDEHRPETAGAAPSRQRCGSERVRLPRGDGTTTVTRIDKCQRGD
ncbi:MAG: hypothetical protein K2Z80_01760 [Xanthobacteraceae bacterium]|nr:hypothetical protein [Xanthobacteraceae bacterium]